MTLASVEDKLAVNKYDVDRDIHINLDLETCKTCDKYFCLYACPAECFKLTNGNITFSYEGCLECGSCRIVCPKGAVDWTLPRPRFGICYQYG